MKITTTFAERLIGMDMKQASFILDKLAGTSFDYPELHIDEAIKVWEKNKKEK